MEHDVIDRLRAARPRTAEVDEHAFDAELLARLREQPIAARRSVPRAVAIPVAAGVTLTATAVVMLAGGPGDVGGPSSASAITQALRWLEPSPDQILHTRSVESADGHTTTRELWQSSDDPAVGRERIDGADTYETAGTAVYDPAANTIYDAPAKPPTSDGAKQDAGAKTGGPEPRPTGKEPVLPTGDPIVAKVRFLLSEGRMTVTGREIHNGIDAWAISLNPDAGRPAWNIWVSAADGKPLEVRDPGRDANEAPQVIRWTTYEVLPETGADELLTLTGAHPSARVVDDPAQVEAARQRLVPDAG
jgi:hypothetical protein